MQIEKNAKIELLISQLDLQEHINHFTSFFSRLNSLYIEGDQEQHFRYIKALDAIEFNAPPKVGDFTNIKLHLQKKGVLTFEQIFEIIKAVRYFRYFKNIRLEGILFDWMSKIVIEPRFDEIDKFFGNDGTFNESLDETLFGLGARIKEHKSSMIESMKRLFHTQKIVPYLVDTQIHYINDEEALLVRGGFNHVLKGAVIGRS
ncbi:MAG: endonuclease MutS2, partial [Epsilonproteobacteria bacterium]|nr:endonuclease MutS2 [Campylobacterota bacterium]